jgi:aspartate racemase
MKVIGIIGGLAWPSTAVYYQRINRLIAIRLGDNHSAKLVLVQTDIEEVKRLEKEERWNDIGQLMMSLSEKLKISGADFFLVACNTMHKSLNPLKNRMPLPFIDIVEKVGGVASVYDTVGLMGSRPTMNGSYFRGRLTDQYGLQVLAPTEEQQQAIQNALDGELAKGIFLDSTRDLFYSIATNMISRGAEAIILACTEFGVLMDGQKGSVIFIDSLSIHIQAAVDEAINSQYKCNY